MASPVRVTSPWIPDTPKHPPAQETSPFIVGVVATVDREQGEITLVLRGGVPLRLAVQPSLVQAVRPWKVVQVVAEGSVVRSLRCL
jgi:hypothetical protein